MKSIRFDFSSDFYPGFLTMIKMTLTDGQTSGYISALEGGKNDFFNVYKLDPNRKVAKVG